MQNTKVTPQSGSPPWRPVHIVTPTPKSTHPTREAQTTASAAFTRISHRYGRYLWSSILTILSKAPGSFFKLLVTLSIVFQTVYFRIGMLLQKKKGTILLVVYQLAVNIINSIFLVPLCQSTYSIQSALYNSICSVAHTQGIQPRACLNHHFWKTASKNRPVLLSKQLKFSKLGLDDLHNRVKALEVAFDKIPEVLNQASRHYKKLESSIKQYSREAGVIFKLFTISGKQAERRVQDKASQNISSQSPGYSLLPQWLTQSTKNSHTTILNTYVKTVRPQVQAVLILRFHLREELTILGIHQMLITSQQKSAERTLQGIYVEGVKQRRRFAAIRSNRSSNLNPLDRTRKFIKTLAIGFAKVTNASASTVQLFQESLIQLENMNRTLYYHSTQQKPPEKKPEIVYLAQIKSTVQQARREFQSQEREDRRHKEFLFRSPTERVAVIYQRYANKITR